MTKSKMTAAQPDIDDDRQYRVTLIAGAKVRVGLETLRDGAPHCLSGRAVRAHLDQIERYEAL